MFWKRSGRFRHVPPANLRVGATAGGFRRSDLGGWHTGTELPKVKPNTPMNKVLYEISDKRLGLTTVVDENDILLGIFTDGDLRRMIDQQQGFDVNLPVAEVMTKNPLTISQEARAVEALEKMHERKINQFVVVDHINKVIGVISMHDLIQAGVN